MFFYGLHSWECLPVWFGCGVNTLPNKGNIMTREATCKILEMIEEGILDKDYVIMACLKYMSEDDVKDMAHANEISWVFEDEEDEEQEG